MKRRSRGSRLSTLRPNIDAVGHVELRSHLPEVIGRLTAANPAVAVTNRNRVEAILVDPVGYEVLTEAGKELTRVRATLPILVAAMRSGTAFPSESLRSLVGTDLAIDWQRMNAFQASFPVETTHGEDGQPLPPAPTGLQHQPIDELDDDLRYA